MKAKVGDIFKHYLDGSTLTITRIEEENIYYTFDSDDYEFYSKSLNDFIINGWEKQ